MRKLTFAIYVVVAGTAFGQSAGETTAMGYVTDTWCGRKGANEKHAEHARTAVASSKAQYAVYDEATRKLYLLDAQAGAPYAGQRVQITGTLSATRLWRAGQSLAPDAIAAYLERTPSTGSGQAAIAQYVGQRVQVTLRSAGRPSGQAGVPSTLR